VLVFGWRILCVFFSFGIAQPVTAWQTLRNTIAEASLSSASSAAFRKLSMDIKRCATKVAEVESFSRMGAAQCPKSPTRSRPAISHLYGPGQHGAYGAALMNYSGRSRALDPPSGRQWSIACCPGLLVCQKVLASAPSTRDPFGHCVSSESKSCCYSTQTIAFRAWFVARSVPMPMVMDQEREWRAALVSGPGRHSEPVGNDAAKR